MEHLLTVGFYAFTSGITILIGGLLSKLDSFPDSTNKSLLLHSVIAFGGGVLLSAVAFVLVPRGIESLSILNVAACFLSGTLLFFFCDKELSRRKTSVSQLMAMMMDFIPEAIALGAVFAHDKDLGLLLALFIGLQNLPEGFNSFKELVATGFTPNQSLLILFPLSLVGVIGSCVGYIYLHNNPAAIAALMLFAAGGIIYLTFQDIAPMSRIKEHGSPALGASAGFLVGILGNMVVG